MGKIINLFKSKQDKRNDRIEELNLDIFDKAFLEINKDWEPGEFVKIKNKFIKHAESLDW